MWRWIMRLFFGRVPTCRDCGHAMPAGGYVHMVSGDAGVDDVIEWETCRECGSDDIAYASAAR